MRHGELDLEVSEHTNTHARRHVHAHTRTIDQRDLIIDYTAKTTISYE